MPFKTIVAILQSEQDAGRVLDCAIPLATGNQGHLTGIHAEAMPVPYTSAAGFPDTEFLEVSAELNKERAKKIEALFNGRVQGTGLSSEWRSLETYSGDSALSGISAVRAADLVIAAQGADGVDDGADIGALVYDAGRPVLVVPHQEPVLSSFGSVLVAWNNTREAARAAFDALPFIVAAERTEVFVVNPPDATDDGGADGSEIAAALARHGANVGVATRQAGGDSIEDVIQARLADTGADLLVLGAYSHSWLRRLLLGGVTRSVLRSGTVAAFLSR